MTPAEAGSPEPNTSAPGSEIRASDSERERVVEQLRQAGVEARLTLDELVERSERAYEARTRGELERLTSDLPDTAGAATAAPAASAGTRARRASSWIVSLMGGAGRKGRWRPADKVHVVAVMGGSEIDLRGAEVAGPEITIFAVAVMGGVDVIVPEGVEVELDGFGLMGGDEERLADVPTRPGTPLVRVRAFSLMGGVAVKSKPPRDRQDHPGEEE